MQKGHNDPLAFTLLLQPDILECKVKWALGSITTNKPSGGDGIPAELFKILKDDAVKVLHSICQQIWEIQQWPQDWKSKFSSQLQRRAVLKNVQISRQLYSLPVLVRLCSKSFRLGFSRTWIKNFQMFKLDLEKAEEPGIKLPAFTEPGRKQRNSRKTSTSVSLTTWKPLC